MNLPEGKDKFLQSWGAFGSSWGVNRTMAQIHALLMIAPEALSADDIMEELKISRGNANMNLRALIDWGLVYKELKAGERKEYFVAEKDMWKVVKNIIIQRKKRELERSVAAYAQVFIFFGEIKITGRHDAQVFVGNLKFTTGENPRLFKLAAVGESSAYTHLCVYVGAGEEQCQGTA